MNCSSNESTTKTLDNEAYLQLLNRSAEDIVKETRQLRASIKRERECLDEWVISQKAFRNLANKFRLQKGISDEDWAGLYAKEEMFFVQLAERKS